MRMPGTAAALCAALFLSHSAAAAPVAPQLHTVVAEAPYRAADYRFLDVAIGDRPVVALGESIHLTREMPLLRLKLLRYLHEQRGMDVLALEGSLLDAWTAQEHAYRSTEPLAKRARSFTREALFGLWQTDEMEQVIAYALSTQSSPHPLYVTSFDLQPGMARSFGGSSQRSLGAFLLAVRAADPQLPGAQLQGWSRALGDPLGCRGAVTDDAAIREMEAWVQRRAPAVLSARRPAVHLEALRLVPLMIRKRLQQCADYAAAGRSMQVYQRSRDERNAELVLAMLPAMPRLVLWAHHSHLHYNSLGGAVPSMGQHLKAALGPRLYTIGLFAAGGAAVDSVRADAASGPGIVAALASRPLPSGENFGVERRLAALSDKDYFVDLGNAPTEWERPDSSRLEVAGHMSTALSRDFDGAVLLHQVSGAELNFLPPLFRSLVRSTGRALQHPLAAAALTLLVLAGLAGGIRALWRRRPRRAAVAVPV